MTGAVKSTPASAHGASLLWADRYKPRCIAEMCYPVYANKLKAWLENFTPVGSPGDDPKRPHGVLLSGPPGIGKTTTVYVVAQELGRTVVEYNASDFRSRKSLREHVTDLINNRAFSATASSYTNVVLLMDEVDGCDIGGVGEVIEMVKSTRIPILCTCNDRWHPKLRSLLNHVEDMRFGRPPCNIVANYLCDRVLAREGITLSKPLLQDVIKRSGSDIRNMLNNLQLWCLNRSSLEQRQLAECASQSTKNGDVGLFDAAEFFLLQGSSRQERHSIEEMQSCYYNADLIDLFVQENYLHFNPEPLDGRDWMGAVGQAAASISASDAAQRVMYLEQNWSVSRYHTLTSSIAPCVYTRGKYESFLSGQQVFFDRQRPVKFPSWLGHNSTATKNKRLLRCIAMQAAHPAKGVSGNAEDIIMDYIPQAWERELTVPLAEHGKDGIAATIAFMDQYHLMRDDWDVVQDLARFKRLRAAASAPPTPTLATAVKSAFTREFNKTHRLTSVAKTALKRMGSGDVGAATAAAEGKGEEEEEENDEDSEGKIDKDTIIITSSLNGKGATTTSTASARSRAKKATCATVKPKPKATRAAAGSKSKAAATVDVDGEVEDGIASEKVEEERSRTRKAGKATAKKKQVLDSDENSDDF